MKLKLSLASLLLSFNLANAETDNLSVKINQLYNDLKGIDRISRNLEFQGLRINFREKKINHKEYPNFYFLIKEDHNGKPLYWARYSFDEEDVQTYFKKLQRTSWRRAVK